MKGDKTKYYKECVSDRGVNTRQVSGNIQKIPEEFFNLPYPTSCPACCHSVLKSICVGRRVSYSRSHLCYWPSCAFCAPWGSSWGNASLGPYFLGALMSPCAPRKPGTISCLETLNASQPSLGFKSMSLESRGSPRSSWWLLVPSFIRIATGMGHWL